MRRHNFKELLIWQLGMEIVDDIYDITSFFPREERFGLTLQMRKSATSIPSNIAEGCGRGTDPQLVYFLDVSVGSTCELETQCLVALRRGYGSPDALQSLLRKIEEEQRMTGGFRERHQPY
jgi:four helix bundle protein